jgi:hypothetical protein
MHATHTVHAMPDLRVAGGHLGDSVLSPDLATTEDSQTNLMPDDYRRREDLA